MRPRLIDLGFLAGFGTFAAMTPAVAQVYPWCLRGDASYSLRCDYSNLEQCRASGAGSVGFCVQNPAYAFDAATGDKEAAKPVRSRHSGRRI
ncbi:MAG TPA: DUF3551 domain-containing protein [Steroidobacteraceae bacterium]|jgi:uncharacterized protein DUF3551|nr:DUF3551 domain-containing protein [Steroidobacteraceae bacterium]